MIDQHVAGPGPRSAPLLRGSGWKGGVLGKVGQRFESLGTTEFSHTLFSPEGNRIPPYII